MNFIFADDSEQSNPTREGMKPLIGLGGVHISAEQIGDIEHEINELCSRYGFPDGEEFKWSPSRNTHMHDNIQGKMRVNFYNELFKIALNYNTTAIVVASDNDCRFADDSSTSHDEDVTTIFLERANQLFNSFNRNGAVIVDKPGGGHKQEKELVSKCLETLEKGTDYIKFDRIPLPVMTADSQHIRLLQLADVITSCSIARLAGENSYSPEIFELINTGDTLDKRLKSLSERGEIPEKLVDVSSGLRKLRNIGANADLGELSSADLPVLDGLTRAILEYVYSAPLLIEETEKRLDKLKKKKAKNTLKNDTTDHLKE
jgi:hypothetical protein